MNPKITDTPVNVPASASVVIVAAVRTPIGNFKGRLSAFTASELGKIVILSALNRVNLSPDQVDEVIMGHVLTTGIGQNSARQAAIQAGIPADKTALQINQVCGSGLRAVAMATQSLRLGEADIIVAGGHESMSRAPHFVPLREGYKMGDATLRDTMLVDGLTCAMQQYHMGVTAENVARAFDISRAEQDEFAYQSQCKAQNALANSHFRAEIEPVSYRLNRQQQILSDDEYPRSDACLTSMATMRPAFVSDGTVTAANSSGLNDGAAACVLMRAETAAELGIQPLARVVSWATAGVDPAIMGTGPVPASTLALQRAGWQMADLERIEANEAFAAQAIAVNRLMGWDPAKVNPDGGAIALGHPIGASGARILTTLIHGLHRQRLHRGLATLCIGGGMGIAMTIERVEQTC